MFKTLSFILLFTLTKSLFGQGNYWEKRSNFGGLKRERAVAFAIEQYGYVGTGTDTAEIVHNDLWRFDPSTNSWSQMADMPAPGRRNAVGFSIQGKGYIGTGLDSDTAAVGTILNDFWEYDPSLNSWMQKADYPGAGGSGVYYATGFAINESGFICAGKIGPDNYVYDLWEWDSTSDTWIPRTSFPGGDRHALSSFVVEGKAYVGMGTDHDLYRKDWWQYDPETYIWVAKADLPGNERSEASTFTLGQRGFVIFGTDGGYSDELWSYNPFDDSWSIQASFPPSGRKDGIAFAIGDTAYAGTGKNDSGKKRSFYAYVPGVVSIENPQDVLFYYDVQSHLLNFMTAPTTFEVSIINLNGQVVQQEVIPAGNASLQLNTELSQGIYLVYLKGNQIKRTFKIIIA